MSAPRFTERNVIRTLILQGTEIRCYRTKQIITLENVEEVEREHNVPTAIGGENTPWNCFYSLKQAHADQTKVDVKSIAKAKRLAKAQETHEAVVARVMERPASKLKGRGFDKTKTKRFDGRVVPRV